jgi:hypothetical protein
VDADTTDERFVDIGLVFQLRVLGFDTLTLDTDLTGGEVGAQVNFTKTAATDLAPDAILVTERTSVVVILNRDEPRGRAASCARGWKFEKAKKASETNADQRFSWMTGERGGG